MILSARTLAVCVLLSLPAHVAYTGEDQTLYNQGRSAIFEERWREARAVFEEMNRRYPSSPLADDSHYWLGMALYELREAESAYEVLKTMADKYPGSPWSDDARALRVRCAEVALHGSQTGPAGPGTARMRPISEYSAFIERSTRDANMRVQLLAIDTMLESNPGRAPEFLPRLNTGGTAREAAGMVVDRFFAGERVKVTLENPLLGLRDGNVAIMVRQDDLISYLSLAEATDLIRGGAADASRPRFDSTIIAEIRDKLVRAERNLVREGDAGTVETPRFDSGGSMSAIVKVVDGEVHYYRNGDEVVRIVVLKREAGFTDENVRIFLENKSGVRTLRIPEVRSLPDQTGRTSLNEATSRYIKAALAIIEIDLNRAAAGSGR